MILLKRLSIIFLAAFLCCAQASAVIVEVADLDLFERQLASADEESLVLFDVDDTLIVPNDRILRCPVKETWNKLVKEILKDPGMVEPYKYINDHFTETILLQMEFGIVDAKAIPIISELHKRNIKTIAFTKMFTGPYGEIPSMEDWRINQLRRLGFDFTPAFPQFPEVDFKVKSSRERSLFKQGVLCANMQHKGPVLLAFLERIKWIPSKVFFIDNRLDYLTSVEESLEGTTIAFFGFHYLAVEKAPCSLNEDVAKLQISQLIKTGKWLSDEEAGQCIEAGVARNK